MLRNYFVIAWRNIMKNKWSAAISFLGLSVSLTVYFLINDYVSYHNSFDDFNSNKERIYQVGQIWKKEGAVVSDDAVNWYATGPALKKSIPEIEEQVRIRTWYGKNLLQVENIQIPQSEIYYSEASFFDVFSHQLVIGNKATVFKDLNNVVISTVLAKKLFGNGDPLDQVIAVKSGDEYKELVVSGVMKVPANSHIQPQILYNYDVLGDFGDENWEWSGVHLYIMLKKNAQLQTVIEKYPEVLKPHESIWKSEGYDVTFNFDRIDKIHVQKSRNLSLMPSVDGKTLTFLVILSWVILAISWINYIHLSTSRMIERSKEVGIRKILGSGQRSFYYQFFIEALVYNMTAFLLAFTLFQAFATGIYNILQIVIPGQNISSDIITDAVLALGLGSIITGLIPAVYFNAINLVNVLKGNITSKGRSGFRNVMVVIQFVTSIFLVITCYVLYSQIGYIKGQDPGFNLEKILVVERPVATDSSFTGEMRSFKYQLLQLPDVKYATFTSDIPGSRLKNAISNIHKPQAEPSEINSNFLMDVDEDFIATYGLQLIAGRSFNSSDLKGQKSFIINEKALDNLGFESAEDAIGAPLVWEGLNDPNDFKIVGVVKDYRHQAAKNEIFPTIYIAYENMDFISLLLNTDHVPEILQDISTLYKNSFYGEMPDLYFLDTHYNRQYQEDEKLAKILSFFGIVTVILSCVGLLALTLYQLNLKIKEVSIRKVLGASIFQLFTFLSWKFLRLIVIASILAVPLSFYLGSQWLQNYPVRISISLKMIGLPVILMMVMALISISYQTLKMTFLNPIDNLKEE